MLTEERTAKFNRRINWKDRGKDGQRREKDVRVPRLRITPPGKLREQRDICSTRLQGAFTLMSACHHIQDRRSRYTLRAWARTHTHTYTHTHHIAYTVTHPFPPSVSLSSVFCFRRFMALWTEYFWVLGSSSAKKTLPFLTFYKLNNSSEK